MQKRSNMRLNAVEQPLIYPQIQDMEIGVLFIAMEGDYSGKVGVRVKEYSVVWIRNSLHDGSAFGHDRIERVRNIRVRKLGSKEIVEIWNVED